MSDTTSKDPSKMRIFYSKCIEYTSMIRVYLLTFLFCFSIGLTMIPASQFIQDKICLNNLALPAYVCFDIHTRTEYSKHAVDIYQRSTSFSSLQTVITFLPSIFIAVFLGRWLDKYPRYVKYAMALPTLGLSIGSIFSLYFAVNFHLDYTYLLIGSVPFSLSGSFPLFFASAFTYVTKNSSLRNRAIVFGLLEFSLSFGFTSAVTLGGYILTSTPWMTSHLRNYLGVFAISGAISFAVFLLIILTINFESQAPDKAVEGIDTVDGKQEEKADQVDEAEGPTTKTPQKSSPLADLFDLSNLVTMIQTVKKRRKLNAHYRLWLMMSSMSIVLMCSLGEHTVSFQFVQKVYHWDAAYYSNIRALTAIMPNLVMLILPAILIHKLHFKDTTIGIIGSISLMFACIIKGGFTVPMAFFIAETVHMFAGLKTPAMRSMVSQLIEPDEVSQIFTLIASMDATMPILSSVMYSVAFNRTIETYPGFVYHLVTILMFFPFLVILFVDLKGLRDKPQVDAQVTYQVDPKDSQEPGIVSLLREDPLKNGKLAKATSHDPNRF